jgi:AraC family transcriptional regulator of arabinose operon
MSIDFYTFDNNPGNEIFRPVIVVSEYENEFDKNAASNINSYFFHYVKKGRGIVHIGTTKFEVKAGDSFYIPPAIPHSVMYDRNEPWQKIWINCRGTLVKLLLLAYNINSRYYFPNSSIREELEGFIALSKNDKVDLEDNFSHQAQILLHHLVYKLFKSTEAIIDGENKIVKQLRFHLDRTSDQKVIISDFSAMLGVSTDYLIRQFKKEIGLTPYEYHINKKINTAKLLLTDTALKITEIADQLGFYDSHHFSKLFKKKTGISPKFFREKTVE